MKPLILLVFCYFLLAIENVAATPTGMLSLKREKRQSDAMDAIANAAAIGLEVINQGFAVHNSGQTGISTK